MSDCGHGALIASGEARGLCPLCQRAEIERLRAALQAIDGINDIAERCRRASLETFGLDIDKELLDEAADEIEQLRALLVRYQAANYAPEDSDLYAETRRALEGK